MTPEQFVACIDFRYLTDALTRDDALAILRTQLRDARRARIARCAKRATRPTSRRPDGWAIPTTSCAGYAARRSPHGWTRFKIKVGREPRRTCIARLLHARGDRAADRTLMMDANQVVGRRRGHRLDAARSHAFNPLWIEEPTSPDDVLGHADDSRARSRRSESRPASMPEPRDVQAADAGRGDRLLPDRQLPPRRRQRGAGGAADGGEIRRAGLSACRRRRAVRIRASTCRSSTTSASAAASTTG